MASVSYPPTALATPAVVPSYETVSPPTDGSDWGSQLNDALQSARLHNKRRLSIGESFTTTSVPIDCPDGIEVTGTGAFERNSDAGFSGGTKIQGAGIAYRGAVIRAKGTYNSGQSAGMLQGIRVRNLAVYGTLQSYLAMDSNGQDALLDFANVAYLQLEDIWTGKDYRRAIRMNNVWDSLSKNITITNSSGFCDPTLTADSTALQGATGRSWCSAESALGRSFGVPALEIISPDTDGADVFNNYDFFDLRIESNASNGPGILGRGGNSNAVNFYGGKIELNEGEVPCIIWCDGGGFNWSDGWLMNMAAGSPYNDTGAVKAGTAWSTYDSPATALFVNCFQPKVSGGVNHASFGGKVEALLRFINCDDPQANVHVPDGLQKVKQAMMIFDNCRRVSTARTRAVATPYILAQSGSNQTERVLLNGTTTEA